MHNDETATVSPHWTVSDLIDFDHLVAADAAVPRDDDWRPAPSIANDRRAAFHAWLQHARAEAEAMLPGRVWSHGLRIVTTLAIVLGLAIGFGLAGTLLSQRAAEPVNALLFFAVTVGLQLGVLVLAACAWGLRRIGLPLHGLRATLLAVVTAFGALVDRLDGERRSALQVAWSTLDVRAGRLAPLIAGELLIVTQCFAIAFNVGLLASMLLVHLPFEELRFGWQSTYSFTDSGVAAFVRIASQPWRWMAPDLAPDLRQIAATRFGRGQPAQTLPADAAHAWWPFLLCSIAVYGLAVRTALALGAGAMLRRRLAHWSFDDPATRSLWRRLRGPLVAADGDGPALPQGGAVATAASSRGVDLLIVDRELAGATTAIAARAAHLFHGPVERTIAADIDDDALTDVPEEEMRGPRAATIVVAVDARRDPIVAIADCLRALRARTGDGGDLSLLLVGDPLDRTPDEARVVVWTRFVALHRLDAGVERGG